LGLVALLCAAPASAQPTITALENNYSYILPYSPNYGIAQGSIFDIFGMDLASTTTGLQSFPLSPTLKDTSIAVTVNGTTTQAIPYYVTPGQIAAILPSATPVGTGTITVTSNGQTSRPANIQVVQTEFGLDTLYGTGSGPAVAEDAKGNVLTPTNAANPGQAIVLWGSGVGADPGNPNETIYPQKQNNLTNLNIEVDIGGIPATVAYLGRSLYPGLDQINVTVPPNVQPGCFVSVVVWTGTNISNFASLPIAASGQTCSDTVTPWSGAELENLGTKSALNLGSLRIGSYINAPTSLFGIAVPSETWNNAYATFTAASATQFISSLYSPDVDSADIALAAVSIGSCSVQQRGSFAGSAPAAPTYLDAGPVVNVAGPDGTTALQNQSNVYGDPSDGSSSGFNSLTSAFIPGGGGSFKFDNGSGSGIVSGFSTETTVPAAFVWNERDTTSNVTRSQGVTVTWKNAAPDSLVQISGFSSASYGVDTLATSFTCSAPSSAGTFTVPPAVLLALPPTAASDGQVSASYLAVSNYTFPQSFSAAGLDAGVIYGYVINTTGETGNVVYQ
jgi:uncharacterized protein (TIGR03437 family)